MRLKEKAFLGYKLFNSSFTGLSIGILFTIYQPLEPSTYSLGGIVLASSMLIIAKFYEKLLNINSFYYISLGVEFIILLTLITFMILQYSLTSALLIYMGYQLTFIFGGYLVRAETLVAQDKEFLGKIDVNKQLGYLVGLGASFLFYKLLEYGLEITEPKTQISILHYFLVSLQCLIIALLVRSFS
jgi:putative membrane protein